MINIDFLMVFVDDDYFFESIYKVIERMYLELELECLESNKFISSEDDVEDNERDNFIFNIM